MILLRPPILLDQRKNICHKKSTQNKRGHLNKFYLNNVCRMPDSYDREPGRISRELLERARENLRPAKKRGGFKQGGGGFPIWTCPSFFCPFLSFLVLLGIFPICPGIVRGFSRFVLFLFLGLLAAPTSNSPERVRDTVWTFPEKSGKPLGLALCCDSNRAIGAHSFPRCDTLVFGKNR